MFTRAYLNVYVQLERVEDREAQSEKEVGAEDWARW